MKKQIKDRSLKYIAILALYVLPVVSFAQSLGGLRGLLIEFRGILTIVWGLVITLAFLYFFWGMAQFILNSGDAKVREEGKQRIIWGIIALFVIVSIYGILAVVGNLIGISTTGNGATPLPEGQGDFLPGTTNA